MRIAFLTHQFPGVRLGGIGAYTLNCARALSEAGHEAHVFTFPIPDDLRHILPANVRLHEVADLAARVQDGLLPAALAAAVQSGGEAVYRLALGTLLCDRLRSVHAETPFELAEGPEYEALALPLLLSPIDGLRIITQLHSGSAIVHRAAKDPIRHPPTGEQLLIEAMEAAAILAADAVIAPSRAVIEDTRKSCPVDHAAVLALPFYAGTDSIPSTPDPTAPIVYIGRLEMIKGAHLLPAALNLFVSQHPAAKVRLIGPDTKSSPTGGSMAQWIRSQLDRGIAGQVSFVGEVSPRQLVEELAQASFTIVPSLHDSYSYVCCESLAAGRPVVVSSGIGATEVVGDGGLTFQRGDASSLAREMARLYENPALLQALSVAARRRADKVLSPAATTQARVDFYNRVIGMPRSQVSPADRLGKFPAKYVGPLLAALARLTGCLSGAPDPTVKTPGMRLVLLMKRVSKDGQPARIFLYGAGRHTARLLAERHLWEAAGHRVVGLLDDHPRFKGERMYLGLPVSAPADLLARAADERPAIVLSTDTFQDQFWDQTAPLRHAGFQVFRLYD